MPYKVSCLHKWHHILVSDQSEIEFQVGSYKGKVICDFMPMDVWHILLGRPWKSDHRVVPDGRSSCYNFKKGGTKHILFPLQYGSTSQQGNPEELFLSGKEFLKQIKEEEVSFVVICKPKVVLMKINIGDFPFEVQ